MSFLTGDNAECKQNALNRKQTLKNWDNAKNSENNLHPILGQTNLKIVMRTKDITLQAA